MIGAVDIGGTKIAVGMVDDTGKVLSRRQAPTDPNRYDLGIELIAQLLRETAGEAGVELTGIGIGSTGPVDPMRGEFGDVDFLPGWRGKSPVKDLAQIFNVRVALENDGDAAALAEAGWGAGQESVAPDLRDRRNGDWRRDRSRRSTLSRSRWCSSRSWTSCRRSGGAGVLVRISRVLGIAGGGSGDGGMDRERMRRLRICIARASRPRRFANSLRREMQSRHRRSNMRPTTWASGSPI